MKQPDFDALKTPWYMTINTTCGQLIDVFVDKNDYLAREGILYQKNYWWEVW